jgi:hypothetical protein
VRDVRLLPWGPLRVPVQVRDGGRCDAIGSCGVCRAGAVGVATGEPRAGGSRSHHTPSRQSGARGVANHGCVVGYSDPRLVRGMWGCWVLFGPKVLFNKQGCFLHPAGKRNAGLCHGRTWGCRPRPAGPHPVGSRVHACFACTEPHSVRGMHVSPPRSPPASHATSLCMPPPCLVTGSPRAAATQPAVSRAPNARMPALMQSIWGMLCCSISVHREEESLCMVATSTSTPATSTRTLLL